MPKSKKERDTTPEEKPNPTVILRLAEMTCVDVERAMLRLHKLQVKLAYYVAYLPNNELGEYVEFADERSNDTEEKIWAFDAWVRRSLEHLENKK